MLVHALMQIDPRCPTVSDEARRELAHVKLDLEAQAPKGAAPNPFAAGRQGDGMRVGPLANGDGAPAEPPSDREA